MVVPFPMAMQPFSGLFIACWQVKKEYEHVDCAGGFMGQAGDGAQPCHSSPAGQNALP